MPKQEFSLEAGGPKRIRLSWKGIFKTTEVLFDNQPVGQFGSRKELMEGGDFPLPDGSTLHVQLVKKFASQELQVLRNGQPMPGSASDPVTRLKTAYGIVFFVAALNIVLGLLTELLGWQMLKNMGIGYISAGVGVVFLVLGIFVMKQSLVALILAIVLLSIDGVLSLAAAAASGGVGVGGLVFRVFLIIGMAQGIGAIQALKKRDSVPPASAYPPPPGRDPGAATSPSPSPSDPDNPYQR